MKQVLNTTDLDFNFMANPFTGDVSVKTGVDAIKQSIKTILFLQKYEKAFNFDLDAGLTSYLFENFYPIFGKEIEEDIKKIILKYEPRVLPSNVSVSFDNTQNLNIVIVFSIVNQPNEQQTLTLNVEKTR
jgi:phage baseplate assembly protein W